MNKFQKLYNTVVKQYNLIYESIQSNKIQQILDNYRINRKKEYLDDIKLETRNLLYTLKKYFINMAKKFDTSYSYDDFEEFVNRFVEDKLNEQKLFNKLELALNAVDEFKNRNIVEDNDIEELKNVLNTYFDYWKDTLVNFAPDIKIQRWMDEFLKQINAGDLTDEDLKIWTKENFNSFNRKARREFSFVIALKNNDPIALMYFDEDGCIEAVDAISSYKRNYFGSKNFNFKDVMNAADELIGIYDKARNASIEKLRTRSNNSYYAKLDQMSADKRNDLELRQKKSQLDTKKFQLEKDHKVRDLQLNLKNTMDFAASVGRQAKELLHSEDIFESDSPFTTEFIKLISIYKEAKELYNKLTMWDEHVTNIMINKLNNVAKQLEEIIGDVE